MTVDDQLRAPEVLGHEQLRPGNRISVFWKVVYGGPEPLDGSAFGVAFSAPVEIVERQCTVNGRQVGEAWSASAADEVLLEVVGVLGSVNKEQATLEVVGTMTKPDGSTTQSPPALVAVRAQINLECGVEAEVVTGSSRSPEAQLRYTIHNTGSVDIDDLVLRLDLPAGCFCAQSAERVVADVRSLRAGATEVVTFSVVLDPQSVSGVALFPGAVITVGGRAFGSTPGIKVRIPSFGSLENLAFTVSPSDSIRRGDVLEVQVEVRNSGAAGITEIPVLFMLPEGVAAIDGSLRFNGRQIKSTLSDGGICRTVVARIPPQTAGSISVKAIVEDVSDGAALVFRVETPAGALAEEAHGGAEVALDAEQSYVECDITAAQPLDVVPFHVVVRNGSSSRVVGKLRAASSCVEWDADQGVPSIEYDATSNVLSKILVFGELEPGERRVLKARATMPFFIEGEYRLEIPIFAQLGGDGEEALDQLVVCGSVSPALLGSRLERIGNHPIRCGERGAIRVWASNQGRGIARDVVADLDIPVDLVVEDIIGAAFIHTETGLQLSFEPIIPDGCIGALLRVRFDGTPDGQASRIVFGRIGAASAETVVLEPLSVSVSAASALTVPELRIVGGMPGEPCIGRLQLRNAGDGKAGRVELRLSGCPGYVEQSTEICGAPVRDRGRQAPLEHGLTLDNVVPGQHIVVTWKFVPGEGPLRLVAQVTFDGAEPFEISSAIFIPVGAMPLVRAGQSLIVNAEKLVSSGSADEPPVLSAECSGGEAAGGNEPHTGGPEFGGSGDIVDEPRVLDPGVCEAPAPVGSAQSESTQIVAAAAEDGLDGASEAKGDGHGAGLPSSADSEIEPAYLVKSRLFDARERSVFLSASEALLRVSACGWYRHILAMKMLLADHLDSSADHRGRSAIDAAYARFRKLARKALGDARLEVAMSTFSPSAVWIESMGDAQAAAALRSLLESVTETESHVLGPAAGDANHLVGSIARSEVEAALSGGSSVYWMYATLPVLVPTQTADPGVSDALARYVASYREFFAEICDNDAGAADLLRGNNEILNDYLEQLIAELRANAGEMAA